MVGVEALAALPFIDAPEGIVRRSLVDRHLRRLGVTERNVVLQLGHPEAMKRATREGLGVCLLFRSAVDEELSTGSLREIRVKDADLAVPVYLVYRKDKSFSPVTSRDRRDPIGPRPKRYGRDLSTEGMPQAVADYSARAEPTNHHTIAGVGTAPVGRPRSPRISRASAGVAGRRFSSAAIRTARSTSSSVVESHELSAPDRRRCPPSRPEC